MANSKKPRKKFDGARKASDRLCKATLMISVFGLGSEGIGRFLPEENANAH